MPDDRCKDLGGDRRKGSDAEERFCKHMRNRKLIPTRLQPKAKYGAAVKIIRDEKIVIGDVDVENPITGEIFNAEIKSKYPTFAGEYGIEEYRMNHYLRYEELTGIPVVYVIEKTKSSKHEKIQTPNERVWLWRSFKELSQKPLRVAEGWSWVGGERTLVKILYLKEEWFVDMSKEWWKSNGQQSRLI